MDRNSGCGQWQPSGQHQAHCPTAKQRAVRYRLGVKHLGDPVALVLTADVNSYENQPDLNAP
ncbi:MAG: hypothetical protein OXH09_20645 [Gammaproteobacteria bacterium]|nr:hypothetical protein [Gammaproteobacteria bacterium]